MGDVVNACMLSSSTKPFSKVETKSIGMVSTKTDLARVHK